MSHPLITDQLAPVTLITLLLFTIGVGDVIGVRRSLVYHDIEEERSCVNIATVDYTVGYFVFVLLIQQYSLSPSLQSSTNM